MEEVDTFYVFNISGGIICTACKVPVRLVEFRLIPSCIFSHEMQKTLPRCTLIAHSAKY